MRSLRALHLLCTLPLAFAPLACRDHAPARAPSRAATPPALATAAGAALVPAPSGPPLPSAPEDALVCHSRHLGVRTEHHLAACPADVVAQVVQWRPDAIVVLGGGILAPNDPGCATTQRGFAARQLFAALDERPTLVLSGHGPPEPARALDDTEAACVGARLEQESRAPDLDPASRAAVERDRADLAATRAVSLTESDYLCATILRAYPPARWPAVLAHVEFEPRATSTVENAARCTPLLHTCDARRALVLSTPVVHANGELDNHPARALQDFREDRARGGHACRLAAVGCPFESGGPVWSEFE